MKVLASALFIILILSQIQLWFGSHGVFQLWSLNNDIRDKKQLNETMLNRNEQLHAEVQELKTGSEALEERARSNLGFVKEGETFYRVIPEDKLKKRP